MSDPPRVLLVTTFEYPHTGGASTHMELLLRQLASRGRDAGVLHGGHCTPSRAGRGLMFLAAGMSKMAYLMRLYDRMIAGLAGAALEALRRDPAIGVLHAHDHRACLAARRAADQFAAASGRPRPRVVQTIHGPWLYEVQQSGDAPDGSPLADYMRRRETESFAAADAIIPVDTGQRDIALQYGADAGRMTVVFNAVDLDELDRCAAQPCPLDAEAPYFVVPRRLVQKTGVRFAVEAAALLPPTQRPRVLVAGQGPLREELEQLAAARGVSPYVRFLGPVPRERLIPLMARAAGVIVPSIPAAGVIEATSLAAIEAMALRVPILASAIGGLAEIIEHDRTGLLVPPGDAPALAQAMLRVLENRLPPSLRDDARAAVENRLATRPWFAAIDGVYRRVTGAPAMQGEG